MTNNDTATIRTTDAGIIFEGREAVDLYAFLAIRRSLALRVRTGMSMMRNMEIKAANRHGWSTKRTAKAVLADLNALAKEMGLDPA